MKMSGWLRPVLTILIPGGLAVAGGWYLWNHRQAPTSGTTSASAAETAAGVPSGPSLGPVSLSQARETSSEGATLAFLKMQGMPVPGAQQVAFNPDQLAGSESTLDLPLV